MVSRVADSRFETEETGIKKGREPVGEAWFVEGMVVKEMPVRRR